MGRNVEALGRDPTHRPRRVDGRKEVPKFLQPSRSWGHMEPRAHSRGSMNKTEVDDQLVDSFIIVLATSTRASSEQEVGHFHAKAVDTIHFAHTF